MYQGKKSPTVAFIHSISPDDVGRNRSVIVLAVARVSRDTRGLSAIDVILQKHGIRNICNIPPVSLCIDIEVCRYLEEGIVLYTFITYVFA